MKVLKYKYNPEKKGVFRVSIVKNPAVGEGDLVLMSAHEIKGIFYAPVMIPDLKIQRIDENTGEKFMVYYDAETVEQLANNYFKQNGNNNTNLEHEIEGVEGVYPVESWIVKDSENDKSKALLMPTQKIGTWIMGYKCESQDVLEKIKNQLLQGLSIEGHLDTEEDKENPISKFNSHKNMFEKIKEEIGNLLVRMSADSEVEKTPEELAKEKEAEKMEVEKTPEDLEKEAEAEKMEEEIVADAEIEKATIAELEKKILDLEAELATFKNEATLMSSQLKSIDTAFTNYKAVQMSSQKLGDEKKPELKNNISAKVAEMRSNRI